jgi:broad specificity phosphatase PhoE
MKQPKLLYIVRHGETDFNRERIIQGSGVDTRLNATGHGQAKKFFERYQDIPFDVLITSKLRRTHETMHPFIEKGLPWEQFEEINEMNWGIHEGKKGTPEMIKSYQDMNRSVANRQLRCSPPGGGKCRRTGPSDAGICGSR